MKSIVYTDFPGSRHFSRRQFLHGAFALGAVAASGLPKDAVSASAPLPESGGLIDTNLSLGNWPFRTLPSSDPAALVARLRVQGVTQGWAGSLDALFHKDLAAVNAHLAETCRIHGQGLLVPVGTVNPKISGWEEELRRCADVHAMPAIRLHPNYHGYLLTDPEAERLLETAAAKGLLVQVPIIMEEERTIHPLANVPPVDPGPLPSLMKKFPALRVQLLNAFRTLRGLPVISLAGYGVHFEIAMLEGVEGIANLLQTLPLERLCFGSFAPVFYFESAKLKMQESLLTEVQQRAVSAGNARSLLDRV